MQRTEKVEGEATAREALLISYTFVHAIQTPSLRLQVIRNRKELEARSPSPPRPRCVRD